MQYFEEGGIQLDIRLEWVLYRHKGLGMRSKGGVLKFAEVVKGGFGQGVEHGFGWVSVG